MKEVKKDIKYKIQNVLLFGLILIIGYLLFNKEDPKTLIVEVPKIVKEEVPATIINLPGKTIRETKFIAGESITIENEVNRELLKELDSLTTKHELLKKYIAAIEINHYKGSIEDSLFIVNYTATTTGTLDNIDIGYTFKGMEIVTPLKRGKFKLYGDFGLSTNIKSFSKPVFYSGFALKDRKDIIYRVNYNTEEQLGLGVMIPIF